VTIMAAFENRFYWSQDNLRLHYRWYPALEPQAATVLCLPGLTRNCRDFEGVAERLAGRYQVACLDLRGRGDSAYAADPLSYVPLTYLADIARFVDTTGLRDLIVIGTSLGGILAMLMAGAGTANLRGVVLNDIGPVIDEAGLHRIRGYVGKVGPFATWMHAARAIEASNKGAFPDWRLEDWLLMAKRLAYIQPTGRIALDYDPRIAEPFRLPAGPSPGDLWPAFEALGEVPALSIRGELSDILSAQTHEEMERRKPDLKRLTLGRVGHAPTLDEPECQAAIGAFLAEVC
jgi:pimeloyl-ACP methyl ester carboxylesterase